VTSYFYYSIDEPTLDWASAQPLLPVYGPKGTLLTVLPRLWTPPFVLIPASFAESAEQNPFAGLTKEEIDRLWSFCREHSQLILRSSIIGETIWDRGTYESAVVPAFQENTMLDELWSVAQRVIASAEGHQIAFVLQEYRTPVFYGEFGNLLRISKTRDHWEINAISESAGAHRTSINTQRDVAADPTQALAGNINPTIARSFGSIAAWINNELLLGVPSRVNCEWVFDGDKVLIVQLDEEGPDFGGVNPLQVRIPVMLKPLEQESRYLRQPTTEELRLWDKLIVVEQLTTGGAAVKPTLFFLPLEDIAGQDTHVVREQLTEDFANQIGPDEIIIRTSVRSGKPKITNLPKTEGLTPPEAADWCLEQVQKIAENGRDPADFAFVAHRFIASRASAWVRCEPDSPNVEIHVNWGLADALQYYAYDKVDVHVPTNNVSYYPDYKSYFIMPNSDGSWRHERVKNEVARSQCISRAEVLDVASRSLEICKGLGEACHIMWFIGCVYDDGTRFNLPWYWTKIHNQSSNPERVPPKTITVRNIQELDNARERIDEARHSAIDLCPTDLDLMRDTSFLEEVAKVSIEKNAPVILAGSPLAHAYYQLQKNGCSVISKGERLHTRVRNAATMGKLVRDKIPDRIKESKETGVTKVMPDAQVNRFLVSKLVEEALEYREASTPMHRLEELADAFEIICALVEKNGSSIQELFDKADKKREKAGGFREGVVLIETSIGERKSSAQASQVLAQKVNPNGAAGEI
jgi:predicted house-cleaning noncanonical NTP pyrophosphatase (MazG superfamily)